MSWRGAYDESLFIKELLRWSEEREKLLIGAGRNDCNRLLKEDKEFEEFIKTVSALKGSDDPISLLIPLAGDLGKQHPDIFVLRKAQWAAYYLVDITAKTYVGIFVSRDPTSSEDLLRLIEAAMTRNKKPSP